MFSGELIAENEKIDLIYGYIFVSFDEDISFHDVD
jgi:hypothetical protein